MSSRQVRIKLRTVTYTNDTLGQQTPNLITDLPVWGFRESIRANDYFNSLAHDKKLDYKFIVRSYNYTGQLFVVNDDGKVYVVERTFEPSSDWIELYVYRARGETVGT